MRRVAVLLATIVCSAGAFQQALAQKSAPAVTRDSDHDGVSDIRDRCRGTPIGTRVDANGCPIPAGQAAPPAAAPAPTAAAPTTTPANPPAAAPGTVTTQGATPTDTGRTRPSGLPSPGPAATPPAQQPAASPPAASPPAGSTSGATPSGGTQPIVIAPAPVVPPAAAPAPDRTPAAPRRNSRRSAPVVDPSQTAGFWMPVYTGRSDADHLDYAGRLVVKLDSAVVALIETFRNTSGYPLAGATDPTRLSAREKARWLRCRNVVNDIWSIGDAASDLRDSIPGGPAVQRAAVSLGESFDQLQALEGCDVVNSMMDSPDRFNPWQQNYETEARNFYRDWYGQIRAVHTSAREFARVLNGALPADRRRPVPSAIPTTPPYVGAVR